MKIQSHCSFSGLLAAVVAVAFLTIPVADARKAPAGPYVGNPAAGDGTGARGMKLREFNGRVSHGSAPISILIPNPGGASNLPGGPRGRFSGAYGSAGLSLGFLVDAPINGRLRTSEIRRGGKKFLITGKWTWRLNRNRLDERARGKFSLKIIRKLENGNVIWEMSGPVRIGHDGNNPETNYIYTGRFKAINRPGA